MLTLQDHPNRIDADDLKGAPHAADESNVDSRSRPDYPLFVRWRANDDGGNPVTVVIGFHTIKTARANAILIDERATIQEAANKAFRPGASEVVLLAPASSPFIAA